MSSRNSAEIQYIWKAIRESERSDEDLFVDIIDPGQDMATSWMKKLRRQMRLAEQPHRQKSKRRHRL